MRKIDNIVLHCTATPSATAVESITKYWKDILKWQNPGYHFIIEPNGKITSLFPIEKVANGVKGHNQNSIHISYIGGLNEQKKAVDTRTNKQILSTITILLALREQFPNANILGHRDFEGVNKSCPGFDVKSWLKCVGLR